MTNTYEHPAKTTTPSISAEEQERRRKAIVTATRSMQLSGFEPDPAIELINTRYIAGEMTRDDYRAAVFALAGRPDPGQ